MSSTSSNQNNFDIFRIYLALVVFFAHYSILTQTPAYFPTNFFIFNSTFAVNCFFIVSGYLITKSWIKRPDIRQYSSSRIKRILPLYFLVVCSSFILGIFTTSLPPSQFFQTGGIHYLLFNLVFLNFLHPDMPGLFTHNPVHAVNGSLWTIKLEVAFYLLVPIIYSITQTKKSRFYITVILFILSLIAAYLTNYFVHKLHLPNQLTYQIQSYFCYFMAGAIFNFISPTKKTMVVLFISSILYFCLYPNWEDLRGINLFSSTATAVFVITICEYIKPSISVPNKVGDISYGIYALHFPIIQFLIQFRIIQNDFLSMLLTLFIVLILSLLSWHLFEKKILSSNRISSSVSK